MCCWNTETRSLTIENFKAEMEQQRSRFFIQWLVSSELGILASTNTIHTLVLTCLTRGLQ